MTLKTTKEVAKELQVEPGTLRAWRAGGKGPPWLKLEGAVKYEDADLKAWKEKQRRGGK